MKRFLSIFFLTTLIGYFNYSIMDMESIKAKGETLYLELAPFDPRSLMQGDYMRLGYKIREQIKIPKDDKERIGKIVVKADEKGIGRFVRLDRGELLQAGEKVMNMTIKWENALIRPDSFFFEEGHAQDYAKAKYGIFKFKGASKFVLVGLADEHFKPIHPKRK